MFAYAFWMRKKGANALANAKPAFTMFFERTGYRYADLVTAPAEAQADRAMADAKKSMSNYEVHYVRNYHGLPVHYSSATGTRKEGDKNVFWLSNQWEADLSRAPRVPVHIADKSLHSTLKAATELFSNSKRVFNPRCREKVLTGIPELDSKYGVWSDDPAGAQQMFRANPALVSLLSGWAELDVSITGNRAVFADPTQKNMQAAMGGTMGSMAIGFDYSKRLELAIPTHDRVADLFAALVQATS
jgi:hypothetical protein